MSLLLDALKEAGNNRNENNKSDEKKEDHVDYDTEIELLLDDVETEGSSSIDVEDVEDVEFRNNTNPGLSVESVSDSKKQEVNASLDQENVLITESENIATAVFRNRNKKIIVPSKFIIISALIFLLFAVVLGYIYWSWSSASISKNHLLQSPNEAGVQINNSIENRQQQSGVNNNIDFSAAKESVKGPLISQELTGVKNSITNKKKIKVGAEIRKNDVKLTTSPVTQNSIQEKSKTNLEDDDMFSGIKINKRKMPNQVRGNIYLAQQAIAAGRWNVAEINFHKALEESPNNIQALMGMAEVMQAGGKNEVANQFYLAVIERAPGNLKASIGLLNLKQDKSSLDHGNQLKQLITENSGQAFLHASLGDYYVARAEWSAAQAAYFEAVKYDSSNADYAYNLAVSMDQLGKGEIALRYYEKALALKKTNNSKFNKKSTIIRIHELSGVAE